MRILDAESQLVKDFIGEIEVVATKTYATVTVHVGRHPVLGKVVVVKGERGDGLIVELEQ